MGITSRAGAAVTTLGLVACSTFSSDGATTSDGGATSDAGGATDAAADGRTLGPCGHTYCQDFEKPLAEPWELVVDTGSVGAIEGGHFSAQVPGGDAANGARVYLAAGSATRMKCGVTVTLTKVPVSGDIYLMGMPSVSAMPNTFVGVSLSPSQLTLRLGDTTPVPTTAIPASTPTHIELDVDGDGTHPQLIVGGGAPVTAVGTWTFGRVEKVFFGLKPNQTSDPLADVWSAQFDDAWCDVFD